MTFVNLGVGPYRAPEPWLNLDAHMVETADLLADATRLCFAPGSVDRAHAGHLLEHIPWPRVPAFLAGVRRVLRAGGELLVVGPDIRKIVAWYCRGDCDGELLYGALEDQTLANEDPWLTHKWNMTEPRVMGAMLSAGFAPVRSIPMDSPVLDDFAVPSRIEWQCAVLGVQP